MEVEVSKPTSYSKVYISYLWIFTSLYKSRQTLCTMHGQQYQPSLYHGIFSTRNVLMSLQSLKRETYSSHLKFRPSSLTSTSCKIFEHIILSNSIAHFEQQQQQQQQQQKYLLPAWFRSLAFVYHNFSPL